MISADSLRLATALAHTVPGVALELRCCNDEILTVAHARLDAQLDPCQLRSAVVASHRCGAPRLAEALQAVVLHGGLEDLGGGLYRRQVDGGEERWFATLLCSRSIAQELDQFPVDVPDGAMSVSLKPDAELGVTVVRIVAADPTYEPRLDEVGFRALSMCMVAETLAPVLGRSGRG